MKDLFINPTIAKLSKSLPVLTQAEKHQLLLNSQKI